MSTRSIKVHRLAKFIDSIGKGVPTTNASVITAAALLYADTDLTGFYQNVGERALHVHIDYLTIGHVASKVTISGSGTVLTVTQ